MSLERIKKQLEKENIAFGPHLVERMLQFHIDLDQILSVIMYGKVNKKEPDERSGGQFTKYTLTKGSIGVVVKDSEVPFVITTFRR